VSKEIDVKIGEEVVTSGMDNIYPKGLLIGHVTGITKEGGELFQVIEVTPSQDLNVVEEVTVFKK
jgi:rod shape-determining protein MreC